MPSLPPRPLQLLLVRRICRKLRRADRRNTGHQFLVLNCHKTARRFGEEASFPKARLARQVFQLFPLLLKRLVFCNRYLLLLFYMNRLKMSIK